MIAAPDTGDAPAGGQRPPAQAPDASAPPASEVSTVDLLMLIVADGAGLLRTEAALAQRETAGNVRRIATGAALMAAGVAALLLGGVLLLLTAMVALAAAIGWLWAALAGALGALLAGGLLLLVGRSRVAGTPLLPQQTLARVARDLETIARRREARTAAAGAGERKEGGNGTSVD